MYKPKVMYNVNFFTNFFNENFKFPKKKVLTLYFY